MQFPVELKINPFSLPTQKINHCDYYDLFLYADRLEVIYRFNFTEKAEDPGMPDNEDQTCNNRAMYFKKTIGGVERYYIRSSKKYKVDIVMPGMSDEVYFWFKSKVSADLFFDILQGWLLNNLTEEMVKRFTCNVAPT